MKIKKLISAVLFGSMLLCMSGCNISDFSADNLLRPPKAVGDEAEIEQLIAKPPTAVIRLSIRKTENSAVR